MTTISEKIEPTAEQIFRSGNELKITEYLNRLAYEMGLTDEQLFTKMENKRREELLTKYAIISDFVPFKQSNRNVRSFLEYTTGTYEKWKEIADSVKEEARYRCATCKRGRSDSGNSEMKFECHEVWAYEYSADKTRVQRLERLECLCEACHKIKHANQHIRNKDVFKGCIYMYSVLNDISHEKAWEEFKTDRFHQMRKKEYSYKLDLSLLKQYGVRGVTELFDCHERKFDLWLNMWKRGNKENAIEYDNDFDPTDDEEEIIRGIENEFKKSKLKNMLSNGKLSEDGYMKRLQELEEEYYQDGFFNFKNNIKGEN